MFRFLKIVLDNWLVYIFKHLVSITSSEFVVLILESNRFDMSAISTILTRGADKFFSIRIYNGIKHFLSGFFLVGTYLILGAKERILPICHAYADRFGLAF